MHDGAGGLIPGATLGSISQDPVSEWSLDKWTIFTVKWDEWVYVFHAIAFFCTFGTTPEMRSYYRAAFWFIPERLGYKRKQVVSETATVSNVAFNSNPGWNAANRQVVNRWVVCAHTVCVSAYQY